MEKGDLIRYVGIYRTKPPSGLFNDNYDIFRKSIPDIDSGEKLASHFGFKIKKYEPSVWLYIPKFTSLHYDRGGKCLVYLYSGKGTLIVFKGSNYQEYDMLKNNVIIFNDRLQHIWLSHIPCKLLTCNIINTKNYENKNS